MLHQFDPHRLQGLCFTQGHWIDFRRFAVVGRLVCRRTSIKRPYIKRPSSIKWPISKPQNICNTITIKYRSVQPLLTVIKWPLSISDHGHPESGPKCCFILIFSSIKQPDCIIYLAQHLFKRTANKSRAHDA